MGLSGDERSFLHRILDHGPQKRFIEGFRSGTDLAADEAKLFQLAANGFIALMGKTAYEKVYESRWILTEAAKEFLASEKRNNKAFSDGCASGKKMFGNAVNRLRAKLSDQRIPGMLNKVVKHFSRMEGLADLDRDLLKEAKDLLAEKVLQPRDLNEFVLNGELKIVPTNVISYSEIIEAAGYRGQCVSVTVTQKNPHEGEKAFILTFGETVFLKPGWTTRINAATTGAA